MIKNESSLIFACLMGFVGGNTGLAIPQDSFYCDTTYFDSGSSGETYEVVINYDNYDMFDVHLEKLCPIYRNLTQLNSCAPLAGSIVIGYYDDEFNNLIPDYESGYTYNGKFYFRPQNDTVIAMKEYLYELMGTNSINPGTSVSQFKNGLTKYVNQQGYSISYSSCGGSFNIETAKSYISQQKPIVLFLNSYEYYVDAGISQDSTHMSLLGRRSSNGHVLVVYGYREFKFYTNNQLTRTEKFLIVAFGDGTKGYLSVNSTNCIDEAYAISIY